MYIDNGKIEVVQKVDGNGDWVYGISPYQVSNLVGQILTQLEAMGLSENQLKANKSVFNRMTYGWFEEVKENCRTAAIEQLKPFEVIRSEEGFEIKNSTGKRILWETWDARLTPEQKELTK